MVSDISHSNIYSRVHQTLWRSIGSKLYIKRNEFLANLLSQLAKDFHLSPIVRSSENFLLDIGCGTGELTQKTSKIFHLNSIGISLDRVFVSQSESFFMVAEGCYLPFQPKVFVLATAYSVIEHIRKEYRHKFFEEVGRVLVDQGFFIIQLPNRYFPIEQHSLLPFVGFLPSRLHGLFFHSYYVSVPSREEMISELEGSGFKIVLNLVYAMPFQKSFRRNPLSKILPFGFVVVAQNTQ